MHTLYLLRHAKSSWSNPTLPDHERPLAPRGLRDAKRIAKHLRRLEVRPALVLCSSATRTRETFGLIQPALGDASVQVEEELYAASSDALLERLRAVPDEVGSLLLIGHNPGLYDLALLLASTGAERDRLEAKFPTAGFATLAVWRSPWSRLSEGDADLVAYVVPKQLR
jgi:phosphohistidine phosphatase